MKRLPDAAALLSLLLMGACGVGLLIRLTRVLRGQEPVDGPANHEEEQAPAREIALAMGAAVLSRVLVYLIAYGMYAAMGGEDGFFASLRPLWVHWDTRHYVGIAQEGYTAVGDERLRLVFFPGTWSTRGCSFRSCARRAARACSRCLAIPMAGGAFRGWPWRTSCSAR